MSTSRRTFLRLTASTALGMTLGPAYWRWATASGPSPFGPLEDDLLLRLPVGFSYRVVARTGMLLTEGRGPYPRPNFPDLNVVFPQSDGTVVLATSHEIPAFFPVLTPAPREEYDPAAGGSVTSLHLDAGLEVLQGAYHAGGMFMNCSGSGTPWGTVLTGEETTQATAKQHGYVWEVDLDAHTKTRLDGMGRFEHETAVVHPSTGIVYLTEDSGTDSLLYRFLPGTPGNLAGGGTLQAFAPGAAGGPWVTIADPTGATAAQGIALGAAQFKRLEGGAFDPLDPDRFYFTETDDPDVCGRVWRLNVVTNVLELWAEGSGGGTASMCMPDNLAFDAAGNVFLCEDNGAASPSTPNRVLFVDRTTGEVHVFGEVVQYQHSPEPLNIADEPTGPAFWHRAGGSVLFLNLQRSAPVNGASPSGVTLAVTGPFAAAPPSPPASATAPLGARRFGRLAPTTAA